MSALELAQSLIKIKSISPKDGGCFELIEAELSPLGFQIERIPELNCETLLAKYGDSGKVFCYLGHTDVVPLVQKKNGHRIRLKQILLMEN